MASYQPYQQRQHSVSGPSPSQYTTGPPQPYPAQHTAYGASGPQDIPRLQHGAPPAQYYGTTPPTQFGTSPSQYGSVPAQTGPMYGTTPPAQHLAPYSAQVGYPVQPQSQPGFPPQEPYDAQLQARRRASSTASHASYKSHKSHKSHHSSHSKHSYDGEKEGRRKNSRVQSPTRPTFGDTLVLMFGSIKGAFDSRK